MSHQKCIKPKDEKSLLSFNNNEINPIKWALGPGLESKFDELKYEVIDKMDREINDATNTRTFIAQKYNDLCTKIQYLSELEATVSGFRSDVKAVDRQISELASRVDSIEKKVICKECPSLSSSMF